MMTTIYDFPRDWYGSPFDSSSVGWIVGPLKYRLRSINQSSARMATGAQSIKGPRAQFWLVDAVTRPLYDPDRSDMDSLLSNLRGRANALRFADPTKLAPWYDRQTGAGSAELFSDGTSYTDGTAIVDGLLPPTVYVAESASKGSRYIVLKGFPASLSDILRRNDPFEVLPNGVPADFPHRYHLRYGGSSDAAGQVGVAIEPPLRADVAANDTVSLRYASSVFRLTSDDSGEMETADSGIGSVSFSLIEALDLVP